ncbi:MAG: hypothetical protein NTW32_04915 [Chloroflexi bacterium]|nr:hypothetical protein [Chloroflexota bacterium]
MIKKLFVFTRELFVLALNHFGSAARTIKNRWFTPASGVFAPVLGAKLLKKGSFTPFLFLGREQGDGLSPKTGTPCVNTIISYWP